MDYYTQMAAEDVISVPWFTDEDFKTLESSLVPANDDVLHCCIELDYNSRDKRLFIYSSEGFSFEDIPDEFVKQVAAILSRIGNPWLEFGVSHTASRIVPGSEGGFLFRIYADGRLVESKDVWPE